MSDDLRSEITAAINRHSREKESATPDFVLAQFLLDCLDSFDRAVVARESWYGRR